MINNLQFGHDAGIWNHTFNFFGFPTETEGEAEETIQFLLNHSNILHSEGTGTFVFEHNAPIHNAPARFGVKSVRSKTDTVLDLFYEYEPETGLDASGASEALDRFNALKSERGVYQHGRWIEREHLLLLLSRYGRDELKRRLVEVEAEKPPLTAKETLTPYEIDTIEGRKYFVVNRHLGQVCVTNEDAVRVVQWLDPQATVADLIRFFPTLAVAIEEVSSSPVGVENNWDMERAPVA